MLAKIEGEGNLKGMVGGHPGFEACGSFHAALRSLSQKTADRHAKGSLGAHKPCKGLL